MTPKDALKQLLSDKSFWAVAIGLAVYFGAKLGLHVDPNSLWVIAGAFTALLTGHAITANSQARLETARLNAQAANDNRIASEKARQAGFSRLGVLVVVGLVGLGLITASCAWWQKSGKAEVTAGGKAAAACVIGDVEQYGGEIVADLGKDTFDQALSDFAKSHNFTQDAMNCLVRTVLAVMAAGQSPSTSQPTTAVLHARAYLATHGTK